MSNNEISKLNQANCALRDKQFAKAVSLYLETLQANPALSKIINGNLKIAQRKFQAERGGNKLQRVAVCGWELAHNAAGRVYTLAKLYETFAEVEIIGSIFPKWGRELWGPIRNTTLPHHTFVVEDESRFVEQAMELVAAHPYDIVHLSKPRMPNIFFGLLYKLIWDAKVLMDIDDEELAFVKAEQPITLDSYLQEHGRLPELKNLPGKEWTQLAVGLAKEFDGVTVANTALQKRYGGEIIRHARDEKLFKPSLELKRKSREKYGVPQDKKVVLFFGTPREHKGLMETAQAIAALKKDDVLFVIVGEFPDQSFKEKLQQVSGCKILFIGNQPFSDIQQVVAIADCCVFLQDEGVAAKYQVPAKLTDALGMGVPVLASSTPALEEFFQCGAINKTSIRDLKQHLADLLQTSAPEKHDEVVGRSAFVDLLSITACARNLQHWLGELPSVSKEQSIQSSGHLILSEMGGGVIFEVADQLIHPELKPKDLRQEVVLADAELFMRLKKWPQAKNRFEQALSLQGNGNIVNIYAKLSLACLENKDIRAGKDYITKGLSLAPRNVVLLRRAAEIEMAAGNYKHAQEYWSKLEEQKIPPGMSAIQKCGTVICRRVIDDIFLNAEVDKYLQDRQVVKRNEKLRVAVVTGIFGNYDALHLPITLDPEVDYIVFTDQPVCTFNGVYELRKSPYTHSDSNSRRAARYVKTHLPTLLPEYDYVIWKDSNIIELNSWGDLVKKVQNSKFPFGGCPHPDRCSILEEAEACIRLGKDDRDVILKQIETYRKEVNISSNVLLETGLMIFNIKHPKIKEICDLWWREIEGGSVRDQISLPYVLQKLQFSWCRLWDLPVSIRVNSRFALIHHGYWANAYMEMIKSFSEQACRRGQMSSKVHSTKQVIGQYKPQNLKRNLTFVYRRRDVQTGTQMRGYQLQSLLTNSLSPEWTIKSFDFDDTSCALPKGDILWLTRSFLKHATDTEYKLLRSHDNILLIDNIDYYETSLQCDYAHVFIAACFQGLDDLQNRVPSIRSHLVTHLVDPEIEALPKRFDHDFFSIAYFGELVTPSFINEIAPRVTFIQTNNAWNRNRKWIQLVQDYPAHISYRDYAKLNVLKPFTKGFIAAHSDALILCPRFETDASHYLSDDYPFWIEEVSVKGIREAIEIMKSSYGTKRWSEAKLIMENIRFLSSSAYISDQVRELLSTIHDT